MLESYGFIYPFIELALGLAFLFGKDMFFANVATLVVMGVSSTGVIHVQMKKSRIQCACLGTVLQFTDDLCDPGGIPADGSNIGCDADHIMDKGIMKLKTIIVMILLNGLAWNAWAQHDHHMHESMPEMKAPADTSKKKMDAKQPAHEHHADSIKPKCNMPMEEIDYTKDPQSHAGHDHEMMMTNAFSKSLPMSRNGSGTSWMPDESPMAGYMFHHNDWNMMVHGSIFPRYTNHDVFSKGSRGSSKWDAPNWFMLMANHEMGAKGLFNFNLMMSLDPLTEGKQGYPLLFQSGETYNGQPLVDRQHPHDLFSELSIGYTHMINDDIDITGYLGYPGEPALGPPAFMHRTSAENNVDAPLGHHWQDATHITFGVATLGVRYKMLKLEGSSFTGREPGENRYDFDKPRFDSYSYRLSFNPSARWAMQVSNGNIESPETLEPGIDIRRTTASVIHTKRVSEHSYSSTAAVWGLNRTSEERSHSFLLESNYQLHKYAVYGRYEYVQKSPHELALHEAGEGEEKLFHMNALTLGSNRIMMEKWKTQVRLGLQATLYKADERLEGLYGNYPLAAESYLRINPSMMR